MEFKELLISASLDNASVATISFSTDPGYSVNWGVPPPKVFEVKLDPVESSSTEEMGDILRRRLRRQLMREATKEFTLQNEQLLRDLAR